MGSGAIFTVTLDDLDRIKIYIHSLSPTYILSNTLEVNGSDWNQRNRIEINPYKKQLNIRIQAILEKYFPNTSEGI